MVAERHEAGPGPAKRPEPSVVLAEIHRAVRAAAGLYGGRVRASRAGERAAEVVEESAAVLGAGLAGLVNALDPDVVTIAGLAIALRTAAPSAFERAYLDGLMAFRRASPPPVRDSLLGDDGALLGAAAVGLDVVAAPEALAAWAEL